MTGEIYKGRRLRAKRTNDRFHGRRYEALVNGVGTGTYDYDDPQKALDTVKAWIDFIDRDPVIDGGRWPAHWYAPGTYTLCEDNHPVALDGECRHPACAQQHSTSTPA